MNINLKLSGMAENVVEEMIMKGYAATKTEAIRMAILDYKHHHLEGERADMTKADIADLHQALKEFREKKTVRLGEV
jgi:hypothetical protein